MDSKGYLQNTNEKFINSKKEKEVLYDTLLLLLYLIECSLYYTYYFMWKYDYIELDLVKQMLTYMIKWQ